MVDRSTRTVAIAVVLISAVSISLLGLEIILNPRVQPGLYYEEIDQGFYCGIITRSEYVIDDNETWNILWTNIHNISIETPVLPYVNFSKEVVIAVFLGDLPTGGYSVDIKRIEVTTFGWIIHVDETHPGEGCGVTMAVTQPYHIVKANTTAPMQAEFTYNVIIDNCS